MRNEVKVGILGIVTLALLIFGYKYLKGSNLLDRSKTYYIKYPDVGQMDPSSPVLTRGYKVGTVTKLQLDPDNPKMILVTIEVKNEINIPKSVKAILVSQGLIGGKAIVLQFEEYCTDDCLANNSIIANAEIAGTLSSMFSKDELKDYTQTFGEELNHILDTSNVNQNVQVAATVKNIHFILDNLAKATKSLNQLLNASTVHLDKTLSNLDVLTTSLANNANTVSKTLQNIEKISSNINQSDPGKLVKSTEETMQELNKTLRDSKASIATLNSILTEVKSGNGSLTKLIKDPALYQNLNSTSHNLSLLMQDLRLNPKRYIHVSVFGKKAKEYSLPENDPAEKR